MTPVGLFNQAFIEFQYNDVRITERQPLVDLSTMKGTDTVSPAPIVWSIIVIGTDSRSPVPSKWKEKNTFVDLTSYHNK